MGDGVQILIAIQGTTLLAVVVLGFRVARHLGRVEACFDLMWADFSRRKFGTADADDDGGDV